MSGELLADPWCRVASAATGNTLRFTRRENDWIIDVGEHLGFCVECMWRIRTAAGIELVDTDDGQIFGLPAPVDAEASANGLVANAHLVEVALDETTADLAFRLSNGSIVEVLSNSSGYESWQAYLGGELMAVGGGQGLR
ncbi:hypothetical protein [Sphingomonas sp. CCH9-E2]|uniref:hypothetical protein n=1 Tax=Sphingomonas sp. CCH9-E2 TaxID=1768776 RepID=UPI0012E3C549|nr:hypothetical protein [Sphingomonas sp. CCH9-E2]